MIHVKVIQDPFFGPSPENIFKHHHHPTPSTPQNHPQEKIVMQCTLQYPLPSQSSRPPRHCIKESCSVAHETFTWLHILYILAVSLDDSGNNECGKSTKLASGSQIQLTTNGKTLTGICGFLVNRIDNTNTKCPYPGICARIDDSRMGSCQAKVAFTGKYFDKTPDSTQV